MAENDVNYLSTNNTDCTVEKDGVNQRASLVVNALESGNSPVISKSFELAVSQGLIPGHSIIDKYGENPDIDTGTGPEDIWEYGGEYIYDPINTAPIVSIVSDDPLDTQLIDIPTGLDITGNERNQTVTLNGTNRVALPIPLWRFNRASNEAGTGGNLNGTVYFYTGTGNIPAPSEIRGIINNGNNQTLMSLYTIPLGKVGFLYRGEIGGSRSQNAGAVQSAYYSRRVGKVFKIKKRMDTTNQGTSIYQDKRSFPDPIPALTDIKLRVESVSANNTGVFGTFDILLIDEDQFTPEFLIKIKQPSEMPS